jgi:4'-phosphopantetheinyl transferase
MPLYNIEVLGKESIVGSWHIQETEEELAFDAFEQCPDELISPPKRLEWLAGRVLIRTLAEKINLPYSGIHKNEFGKPFLKELDHAMSLTHSYPYVAAQIDKCQSVGIDLEQPKQKLLSIGPRVLSAIELNDAGTDITKHCVYWCAKEALYKIYGKRSLHFSNQLNIEPFALHSSGLLKGHILVNSEERSVTLIYRIDANFVIVYTQPIEHEILTGGNHF